MKPFKKLLTFFGVVLATADATHLFLNNIANPFWNWLWGKDEGKLLFPQKTIFKKLIDRLSSNQVLRKANQDMDRIMGKDTGAVGVDWIYILLSRLGANANSFEFELKMQIFGVMLTLSSTKKLGVFTPVGAKRIIERVYMQMMEDGRFTSEGYNSGSGDEIIVTDFANTAEIIDYILDAIDAATANTSPLHVLPDQDYHLVAFGEDIDNVEEMKINIKIIDAISGRGKTQDYEYYDKAFLFD